MKKRYNVWLDIRIIERLHVLSQRTRRQVASLIRQAIEEFLDRMEGK